MIELISLLRVRHIVDQFGYRVIFRANRARLRVLIARRVVEDRGGTPGSLARCASCERFLESAASHDLILYHAAGLIAAPDIRFTQITTLAKMAPVILSPI